MALLIMSGWHSGGEYAIQRKKNSKQRDSFIDAVAKRQNRRSIKTRISEVTARFAKKIHTGYPMRLPLKALSLKSFLL